MILRRTRVAEGVPVLRSLAAGLGGDGVAIARGSPTRERVMPPASSEPHLQLAGTASSRKMRAGDRLDLIPSVHIDSWRGASEVVFSSRAFVADSGHRDGTPR